MRSPTTPSFYFDVHPPPPDKSSPPSLSLQVQRSQRRRKRRRREARGCSISWEQKRRNICQTAVQKGFCIPLQISASVPRSFLVPHTVFHSSTVLRRIWLPKLPQLVFSLPPPSLSSSTPSLAANVTPSLPFLDRLLCSKSEACKVLFLLLLLHPTLSPFADPILFSLVWWQSQHLFFSFHLERRRDMPILIRIHM